MTATPAHPEPSETVMPDRPDVQRDRRAWNAWDLLALLVCLLPVMAYLSLPRSAGDMLPQWDPAVYFRQGHELYLRLWQMDGAGLLKSCRAMVFYPPGYSLVLGAWFLLVGASLWAGRLLTVILFAASGWLLYRLGWRHASRAVGLLAALLLVSSPLYATLGTDIMLEMPGTFLALLFAWACFGPAGGNDSWSLARFLLAGPVLVLCLLTKYNLPVLLVGGTALYESIVVLDLLRSRRRKAAARRLLVVALFVLVWVGLPLVAWRLYIGSRGWQAVLMFLASIPTAEYPRSDYRFYLYYLQALSEYFAHPSVWIASLAGLVACLVCYRRLRPAMQWCCLYALAVLAIMTFSRNHQARYIFMALPFVWLLSGLAAVTAGQWVWSRLRRRGRRPVLVAAIAAACLLVAAVPMHVRAAIRQQGEFSAQIAQATQFIRRCTAGQEPGMVSFAGTFNEISSHSLLLQGQMQRMQVLPAGAPDFWLDRRREELPEAPGRMLATWIANRPDGQRLITLEVLANSPLCNEDYAKWNASRLWMLPLVERCPSLQQVEQVVTDSKIRIRVWTLAKVRPG